LDDFFAEAAEVYDENPWLTYSLQLHRLREFGYHDRTFDLIDNRPLSSTEVRDYCGLLFERDAFDGVDDPSAFKNRLDAVLARRDRVYNPMKKKPTDWIDMKKLNKLSSHKSCLFDSFDFELIANK